MGARTRNLFGYPVSSLASAWKSTKPYFYAKWCPEGMGGFMERDSTAGPRLITRPASRQRSQVRLMDSPHDFDAVHWDHEPVRTVPPTGCYRRLVGRAAPRFLCRQDAGNTLV